MTRERFMALQMAALHSLRADMEEHRKNPMVLSDMRDELERQYRAVLQKQSQWEQGGFWTEENEKKYREVYSNMEA